MKRRGRPIFGITRKTRFAAAMVVVAVVLVMALIVLGYVGIFGLRSELFEIAITTDRADDSFGGVGINCDVIPNINIVRDASFESTTAYSSMLIAGASDGSVYLTPDAVAAAGFDTENCTGDTARIISIDSDGVMSEKFTGKVSGFKPARLGVVTLIKDEKNLWDEDRIKQMTFYGNTALGITENGRLITDVTNSQLAGIVDLDERIVLIDSNDSGVVAVGISGNIFASQDGKNFSLVYEPDTSRGINAISGIGSADSTFAVCYGDGTIVTITNGRTAVSNLPHSNAASFVSDGKRFMAFDSQGNIYSSTNGMVFESVGNSPLLRSSDKPLTCAANGVFCFVVNGRDAVIVNAANKEFKIEYKDLVKSVGSEVKTMDITDSGIIIVCTSDKKAFALHSISDKPIALTSENTVIEKIIGVSGDRVYYDSGKDLYRSQILSELSVEGNLDGVDIIANDILITGHMQKAASGTVVASEGNESAWDFSDFSAWDVYGGGTNVISTDRSYGGRYGARITGRGDGVHAITQTLPGKAKDNFISGTFYRLSLYAMSDDAPAKAYCWIEGEGFGRSGLELTQLTGNYKLYSYVFAVTDLMAEGGEITLNIAFEGKGSVLIDDIYLGPDSYGSAGIPTYYADTLASGSPAAMRLNNLNIGSTGFAETSMYLMSADSVSDCIAGTNSRTDYADRRSDEASLSASQSVTVSLEESLRLVKKCDSTPWLVIGPYVSQSEINNLMEYLCGSMTSEYGGRRIDNGTALPWSRQFTRFYIEINDSGRVFKSDVQKAAYVNYVMSMFSQSEYFSDIKDKTVFLDGMKYDGGTMMSDADNHTMSVKLAANDASETYNNNINTNYVLAQYNTPHIVSGNNAGEYINTLECDGSNCGKVISAVITQEADFAEMFLFDASINFVPSKYTDKEMFTGKASFNNMMTVSGLVNTFTGYDELYLNINEPLDKSVISSVDQFSSCITTACFSKGNITYLVIANSSDSQQSFLINDNKLGRGETVIRRYDAEGRVLTERSMRYERMRHILQPGEFAIVEIRTSGQ
ncbi:MAG: hypothetical protein IKO15_09290 [Clostridiales bacterium]|nr:hypothetical protein [Clostridiales bacterium]